MKYVLVLLLIIGCSVIAKSQVRLSEELVREYIEEVISSLEEEDVDNIEFAIQLVHELMRHPLDLNNGDLSPLNDAGLISDEQLADLISHKEKYGDLLTIYELQTIGSWDLRTIRRIQPMISVNKQIDQIHIGPGELLRNSTLTTRIYASRKFPNSRGFISESDSTESPYEGDPYRHFVILRAQYQYQFSAGITLEKDAGEAFFRGSNQSYDYASFHAYGRDINKNLKILAVGDYKINMGQGLIIHNGFGGNKNAYVTNIKKGGQLFRPHTSTSEVNFFRGAGVLLNFGKHWSAAAFYSGIKRDANVVQDSFGTEAAITQFTSLQTSGLHRTEGEIADEKQIRYRAMGGQIGYEHPKFNIHMNLLYNEFDQPFQSTVQPYNQFRFSGNSLLNVSVDYSVFISGLQFFGESALSDNGASAHLIGLKTGLSRKLNYVALFRHYPRDYQSIQPNAFGEARNAENETGFYNGIEYLINQKFQLYAYIDLWNNPWLRFNVDAPAKGREYVFKFRYYKKRKLETYLQYRYEEKAVASLEETPQNYSEVVPRNRHQLRLHLNYKLNKSLEWRSRLELNHVRIDDYKSEGYLIFQDFIFKPIQSPFSFTTRYAFFNTDDYNSRIYAYENNVLYQYSLPPFFDTGHRFYFNLRYRPLRSLTLELRYDHTIYSDRDETGSGLEVRTGNALRQVAAQIQYVFGR